MKKLALNSPPAKRGQGRWCPTARGVILLLWSAIYEAWLAKRSNSRSQMPCLRRHWISQSEATDTAGSKNLSDAVREMRWQGANRIGKSKMRIVIWNCNMALHDKCKHLLAQAPDIAIIRECANVDVMRDKASNFLPSSSIWFGDKTTSRNPESAAKRCGVRRSSTRRFRFCF